MSGLFFNTELMNKKNVLYQRLCDGRKKFAPLIDPDKYTPAGIKKIAGYCQKARVDFIFFGGSLISEDNHEVYLRIIKENCESPVLLFPGNNFIISSSADGILLLSLISGRNADLLIGKHVGAAPFLKKSRIEIIPTGYMLIDGGRNTSVSYMSNTVPIPQDKDDIAMCTAMAGEMLGLGVIYMDAGSGAEQPVSASMIQRVKQNTGLPLIVGGGIKNITQAQKASRSGADVVVIGNAFEQKPDLILKISEIIHN